MVSRWRKILSLVYNNNNKSNNNNNNNNKDNTNNNNTKIIIKHFLTVLFKSEHFSIFTGPIPSGLSAQECLFFIYFFDNKHYATNAVV